MTSLCLRASRLLDFKSVRFRRGRDPQWIHRQASFSRSMGIGMEAEMSHVAMLGMKLHPWILSHRL